RIDERTAGYLALGLAKASAAPVAVVTTSGTAAVNLHPAVVEADESGIPLLALTADRPGPLRQVGANQAIDQVSLFGSAVRASFDVQVMGIDGDSQLRTAVRYWRSTIARAIGACVDPANPGPVQVNLPFAEPLVPTDLGLDDAAQLTGRPDERPWTVDGRMFASMSVTLDDVLAEAGWQGAPPTRGLILVGDLGGYADHAGGEVVELIDDLADVMGWPIIGEPSGNVSGCAHALAHGPLLLGSGDVASAMTPEFVLTIGRLGLTRSVMRVIAQADCHVTVSSRALWFDPTRSADLVISAVPLPGTPTGENDWLGQWQRADVLAAAAIETASDHSVFTGIDVARLCATAVPEGGLLFLGASWSVRHAAAFAGRSSAHAYVLGNRGTSGIDGSLATAYGAAL
ncbi:MAG: 2-succinyl-5-enolpyruvyl-6-hydroxy-3-cyclohexene-1-carboxylic-acid synthase, partial [Actinomycetales bacterium]